MKTSDRRSAILSTLQDNSTLSVNELIRSFDVTPATIRRDLTYLEQRGLIIRSHGSAQIVEQDSSSILVPGYLMRTQMMSREKLAIAKAAVEFIVPGANILIDSGTTTDILAKQIVNKKGLLVTTNSLNVANTLAKSQVTTSLTGGILDGPTMSLIGPDAEKFIRNIRASVLFLGTTGIRGTEGTTVLSPFQAAVKAEMIHSSEKCILLADASKFSIAGAVVFAPFEDIDILITSAPIQDERIAAHLEKVGTQVIVAR